MNLNRLVLIQNDINLIKHAWNSLVVCPKFFKFWSPLSYQLSMHLRVVKKMKRALEP